MPYQDTSCQEDNLSSFDPAKFDEIQLVSRTGAYWGGVIWHKLKLIPSSARGSKPELEVKQRLLVHVDDENSAEAAARVRIALGLPADRTDSWDTPPSHTA